MAEPTKVDERLKPAREFFVQLRKSAKTIGMYSHQAARFGEFVKPAHTALMEVLKLGPLPLKVTADNFVLGEEGLWTAEGGDSVPYRFYREGVRHLTFRPEVGEEELTTFVKIMLTQTDRGGQDIVSQLWEAGLGHIDYVVVEGFSLGKEGDEQQAQAEVDQVVDYLYARLRATGNEGDTLSFAKVSEADLDLKMEGIEQIRGALFDGDAVGAKFKQRVQEEFKKDEEQRLPRQLVSLVAEQLHENRYPDPEAPAELLSQLLDILLLHEDVAPVGRMLDLLTKVATSPSPGAALAAAVREKLAGKMGEEFRLKRVGEALKHNRSLDLAAVARYLGELTPAACGPLLDVLETMETPESRNVVIDCLARIGKDRPELFAGRLESERSQTVRDMIAIVERGGFPDRARYVQVAMRNPSPAVRTEVLTTLAASKNPEVAHRFMLEATQDKNFQVKAAAYRGLVQLSSKRAINDLLRQPKLPDWDKREPRERELVYECIGLTHEREGLAFLDEQVRQKKTLLGAKKIVEAKLHAITGLQANGTLPAFKLLQREVGLNDPDTIEAARKAMYAVKKAIFDNPAATAAAAAAEPSAEAQAGELYSAFEQSAQAAQAASAEEKARIQQAMAAREKAEREAQARQQAEREAEKQRVLAEQRALLLKSQPPTPPPPQMVEIAPAEEIEFDPDAE